ncbi:MAG: ATP-binding protein [Treponema sp.]|nr:ATP-binding protein [Treponema sp.]
MKEGVIEKIQRILRSVVIGDRYSKLTDDGEKVAYITVSGFLLLLTVPLAIVGTTYLGVFVYRLIIKSIMILSCFAAVYFIRTTTYPPHLISLFPVTLSAVYWLYLFFTGEFDFWIGIWLLAVPPVALLLCGMTIGLIQVAVIFVGMLLVMFSPLARISPDVFVSLRITLFYLFILAVVIIDERIRAWSERRLKALNAEVAHERNIIKAMEDNIDQGIFLMNSELVIQPHYSRPLAPILSYDNTGLEGRSFIDILRSSLNPKQLQIMEGYFSMMFEKTKSEKVLVSANPISEFHYKSATRLKVLKTKFHLIERENEESLVIGIVEDITREKEFEKELQAQKEAKDLEMKNMFDVIQVDPLVFHDFIEDTDSNFNYINQTLKDRGLSEKQVITKFFQNVHAIKSNALVLGLETFGKKLHELEGEIKEVSDYERVTQQDILSLAVKLELIMQDRDSYVAIVKRIESFKSSHQIDSILIHSLNKAAEKVAAETHKKVDLKAGQVDIEILESELRKPIKDILFQCVRNSIYHGIESSEERLRKNKKPRGLLVFSIKNVDGKAEVTFSDDGRGLDLGKIKKKYLEMNPNRRHANANTLLAAIFSPEFSTADEVTEIAGRGVGLSLVKDLVKENRGTINVNNSESGLTFKFTFPLAS